MRKSTVPKDLANTPLKTMLSARVANRLGREGIFTVADLLTYSQSDLEKIQMFGPNTIAEIDNALTAHGVHLAWHVPDRGPTLVEEFRMVLDQRNQLAALIERITDAASTYEARLDIATTMAGMDLRPTTRQIAHMRC